MANIKSGMGKIVIRDNSQSTKNIREITKTSEIKSPAISIKPEENTSVTASKSETTLVTKAPTGVESK